MTNPRGESAGSAICCGYVWPFMSKSVDGGLTVAYTWLLALTVLAWVLVWSTFLSTSPTPMATSRKLNAPYEDLEQEDAT